MVLLVIAYLFSNTKQLNIHTSVFNENWFTYQKLTCQFENDLLNKFPDVD